MNEYKKTGGRDIEILYTTSDKDEEYQLVAQEFIKKIFTEFARGCKPLYQPGKSLSMMPFYYSERRLDSVILPVLSALCKGVVLTELPVKRTDRKTKDTKSEYGRMDYWCIYKGYSFIIEMKKSNDNLNGKVVRKNSMIGRWQSMNEQINDPRPFIRGNLTERTKGVIPIGLHFVTSRNYDKKSLTEDYYQECHRDAAVYVDSYRKWLTYPSEGKAVKPDYCGVWALPKPIAMSTISEDEGGFICPYVMLFCQIGRKITHAGAIE